MRAPPTTMEGRRRRASHAAVHDPALSKKGAYLGEGADAGMICLCTVYLDCLRLLTRFLLCVIVTCTHGLLLQAVL